MSDRVETVNALAVLVDRLEKLHSELYKLELATEAQLR
jgi:hypothetical protein